MAKELKELIYKYQVINCVNNHFPNKDHILASIVCLPTIEAEPVKHGRWIDAGDSKLHCTSCRRYIRRIVPIGYDYCPYCGAKMDEVTE